MSLLRLRLDRVTVRYGDMEALSEVTMEARERAITSIVDSNGAGKSSILKAISGLVPCHAGRIYFEDQLINGLPVTFKWSNNGQSIEKSGVNREDRRW